ncbi:helix-turn-helix transcriptional regulator [Flavobacterium sp. LC2016-01]|uniref:helix-turn-helix domain-containing protein n=1 Tax=Flavobacterium sp. LC2016-01 TaxID=2675876 RepID=UPI0012BAD5A8|nr:helix-turn-helix transcriptional regulator [Flavobacterium sp. LC2016-01]MTH16778.1 helix-turn-helix domain-containing protein [Flavobacterium sp. LC2016-01]
MVNIDDFVKRLEIILDYYAINASSFADKIGVQRSSMSHLLSGRNKPSLDFVMKILEVFPDVDLYWLLNGTGNFPKSADEISFSKVTSTSEMEKTVPPTLLNENFSGTDLFSEISNEEKNSVENKNIALEKNPIFSLEEKEIEKIVIFYKNGTFKAYVP